MGFLTTHVLDTANGLPAKNMALRLYRCTGDSRELICQTQTNDDGRCDQPILSAQDFCVGQYELEFEAGAYFRDVGVALPTPAFLETIPLKFGIADSTSHYHVPLLVSPYSFSTYRGS